MDKLKSLIGDIAPTIASALGGRLAGNAVNIICDVFGLKEGSSEDLLLQAIQANPDKLAELKLKEMEFRHEIEQLKFKDVSDARQMHISLRGKMPNILSFIIITSLFATLFVALCFPSLTPEHREIITTILSVLIKGLYHIFQYNFGAL